MVELLSCCLVNNLETQTYAQVSYYGQLTSENTGRISDYPDKRPKQLTLPSIERGIKTRGLMPSCAMHSRPKFAGKSYM